MARPLLVGLTGVPGAGKTTLSTKLAGSLRDQVGVKVVSLVQEYARSYISRYGVPTKLWEQVRILEKQIAEEERVMNCDVLVTDSPYPLGFLYSMDLRNPLDPKDTILFNDLFKMMTKYGEGHRYDLILHLPPILEPVRDGVRIDQQFDPQWRLKADSDIRFIFRLFPPKKFETLDVELPSTWHSLSDLERRREIGSLRLVKALDLIKDSLKELEHENKQQ